MADIRESFLAGGTATRGRFPAALAANWPKLKLAIRRAVVATAVPPFRGLYAAIYRAHISHAVKMLRQIPGIEAIYVKRGAVGTDTVFGVSDIDFFVLGEWDDQQQLAAVEAVRQLARKSPLYDAASVTQVHSVQSLANLFHSDYLFQFKLNQAREQSVLIFGKPLLASMPAVPADSALGGYYMEAKIWWMMYSTSAFGSGPTAWDPIFRNSVAYKAVAELSNLAAAARGAPLASSRGEALARAVDAALGRDAEVLERFERCAESRFRKYEGDVTADSFSLVLSTTERLHQAFQGTPPFDPVEAAGVTIDAPLEEMPQSEEARSHVRALLEHVRRNWAGYRNAYVMPRNSLAGLDDLLLLFDVDPDNPPTPPQVRELNAIAAPAKLRQRVAIYLLLPQGAYLLNRQSQLEFWSVLLTASANPEVFELLRRPEFCIDGTPRVGPPVAWTHYAARLFGNELKLRRSAVAKARPQGPTDPLNLLRAVWRQLQLEVIAASTRSGNIRIPLTVGAVQRGIESWGLPASSILDELQRAYENELKGIPSGAPELIPKAMAFFSRLLAKA